MTPANTPAAPQRDVARSEALAILDVMFAYYEYEAPPVAVALARAA